MTDGYLKKKKNSKPDKPNFDQIYYLDYSLKIFPTENWSWSVINSDCT